MHSQFPSACKRRAEAEKIAAEAKIAIAESEAKAILTKANAEAEALGIQALEVARMLGFTEVVNGEEQIKSNLSLEEALDLGWEILAECFEKDETGIKSDLTEEFWPVK